MPDPDSDPIALDAHEQGTVASIDPATGEIWRRWPAVTDAEVALAVDRARDAQPAWAARSLGSRRAVLRRFRRLLFEHRGEVASLIERESGKPTAEAMMADVASANAGRVGSSLRARSSPRTSRSGASG